MNDIQTKLKERILSLCASMSVSGFERRATASLTEKYGKYFDEVRSDAVGNHMFIKRCGKKDAPVALVDSHFDEIGMMVTEILDDGFVKFTRIGGVSLAILQAADVVIYGKEEIRGVIISTPPHLRTGDADTLSDFEDLLIDTGYTKETLERIAPVGTPIGFAPNYSELLGGQIAGKSLDDKACAAVCIEAIIDTPKEELSADVVMLFSAFEETVMPGGVTPGTFSLMPDYAMVVDVNLAKVPDTQKHETVPFGEGVSLGISAATDRALTLRCKKLCEEKEIPFMLAACPSSTGTNSPDVNLVGGGVPVVDVGLPLKNMHTYVETISLTDCESLYRLVKTFVTDDGIAADFCRKGDELPV